MPVDLRSRYRDVPTYDVTLPDGTVAPTVGIRPQPALDPDAVTYTVRLTRGDDMETSSHTHLGRSQSWWRVADANALAFPLDLLPGASLKVPQGADTGLVLRRRQR